MWAETLLGWEWDLVSDLMRYPIVLYCNGFNSDIPLYRYRWSGGFNGLEDLMAVRKASSLPGWHQLQINWAAAEEANKTSVNWEYGTNCGDWGLRAAQPNQMISLWYLDLSVIYIIYISIPRWPRNIAQQLQCARPGPTRIVGRVKFSLILGDWVLYTLKTLSSINITKETPILIFNNVLQCLCSYIYSAQTLATIG